MRRLAAILIVLSVLTALLSGVAGPARAETVVATVSDKIVEIRSNFVGTELTLFGSIERDGATVGRAHGYDVVIEVLGPGEDLVVRRKNRVMGIWVNGAGVTFPSAPSYYAVLSGRPLEDISGPAVLRRKGIGERFVDIRVAGEPADPETYRTALLDVKESEGLYFADPDAVEMLTERLFIAHIKLPANIRTGGYRVRVHVFAGGALLTTTRLGFWAVKSGFEEAVYDLAHQRPLVYGLATVIMAFSVGWLGSILFQRN